MSANIAHASHHRPYFEQPRQLADYPSPSHQTDVASFGMLSHFGGGQGQGSTVPRQYAFPAVPALSGRSSNKTTGGLSFAEHALRRKTPNGTIAAGYDASPVDKTVPLPAAKHILVSSLPERPVVPSPRSSMSSGRALEGSRYQPYFMPSHPRTRVPAPQMSPLSQGVGYPLAHSVPNYDSWEFPGGLDSVLNQTLPMQLSGRYYLHHGSSIPTVLPTSLQAFPGPTASPGNEFHGRLSRGGAFVPFPYQPAPVRDDRYFTNANTNHWSASNHMPSYSRQPGNHSYSPSRSDQLASPPYSTYSRTTGGFEPIPRNSFTPGYGITQSGNLLPVRQDEQQCGYQAAQRNNLAGPAWPSNGHSTNFQNGAKKDLATFPAETDFQEKVFKWAHDVYVCLLASIHKSRSCNAANGDGAAQRSSQPNIFPKPPRQPGSNFPTLTKPNEKSSGSQQSNLGPPNTDAHRMPAPQQQHTYSTTIYSPSHRQRKQLLQGSQARPGTGRLQAFSQHYGDRRDGVPSGAQGNLYEASLRSDGDLSSEQLATIAALNVLSDICEQSSRSWIEGMLLAGCLAYGLGDYSKASDWYQAVLARDACHVEAISNLAATLLALDRRDEALRSWRRAVELRPSYFDAVEHLIGLLCGDQETAEAVKVITFVERSLRLDRPGECLHEFDTAGEGESEATSQSRSSSECNPEVGDVPSFDFDQGGTFSAFDLSARECGRPGFGSSGFAIPGSDNGRILALVHAKGNMLYSLNDNRGAAAAFEDAILIGSGRRKDGIRGLIRDILMAFVKDSSRGVQRSGWQLPQEPILLYPEKALQTAKLIFGPHNRLPGLEHVSPGLQGQNLKAAISTTSNSLLSLAKIYQDGLSSVGTIGGPKTTTTGVRDILALYYLSLSLQRSPSTANNVGILLASVQQGVSQQVALEASAGQAINIPGVVPGSGIALALSYYNYGLNLDSHHAHLYTNLGSLLKDIGQLRAAIKMYEQAVKCDPTFDIALANLANAVKDQGSVADAIGYYKRAVQANPEFAEAVCGLATALNSVCSWTGRGGVYADNGNRDRWHVDNQGTLVDPKISYRGSGWMSRVVEIVDKQLKEGVSWGSHTLKPDLIEQVCQQLTHLEHSAGHRNAWSKQASLVKAVQAWSGRGWEGARVVRLIEYAIRRIGWHWYRDRHLHGRIYTDNRYSRPLLPAALSSPSAPTMLPFHTFTAPLSAKQIRQICQRNGLRISVLGLRSSWLPNVVLPPPAPPNPHLNVGYVSSDFNNHPLAHLMQSVFGLHSAKRVRAFCYATTPSDNSVHRQQIERETPVFYDASGWSVERLVRRIVEDGIHILINLNGYTRGARNEVFATRPAPIQMSFMGFAGTLGADWCDYILADEITIPRTTLSPWRKNMDLGLQVRPEALAEDEEDWMYSENIIFARDTFFCCDHRQSAPDAKNGPPPKDARGKEKAWQEEQARRWKLRKELFPNLSDDAVIFGNFNQLYKIDPSTFRLYLRILASVPKAILWLLRFPDLGEHNLLSFARAWTPASVASRVIFTDVAPKDTHILRASVVDLFLDTPECNAHTTAADVVWSGTPVLTWGKWAHKMCSRMAGSIVASALPRGAEGDWARKQLLVSSEPEYEDRAVELAQGLRYLKAGTANDGDDGDDDDDDRDVDDDEDDDDDADDDDGDSQGADEDDTSPSSCFSFRPGGASRTEGRAEGQLMELRRLLWQGRWESRLFDTRRWVNDVETAYEMAWSKWEKGEEGNIWLK